MSSKVPLSNYANILMGQSPKGDTCSTKIIGLPLLNGPTEFGSKYPTPIQFTNNPKKKAKINDILFCVRGSTTGRMNYADQEYAIGRGIAAISGKDGYPTVFVRALIERNLAQLLNIATGSTFPNVGRDMINSFEVENISRENAIKIAQIISILDDKIELNRKMNQTLEEMAQALFKSWFVDFDPVHAKATAKSKQELESAATQLGISKEILDLFPSEFEGSEMGMIPKGWSYDNLGSICSIQSGYAFKGSWWQDTGIKVIKIKNINGTEVDTDDCQCVSEEISTKNKKFILKNGDCLIAMTGATVGKVGIIDTLKENFLLNQRVGRFQPSNYYIEYVKTLVKTNKFFEYIQSEAQGSAQPNISSKAIEATIIVIPSETIIRTFSRVMKPLYFKMLFHQSEITILHQIRDTLLPKLLSGEVDVSSLEIN